MDTIERKLGEFRVWVYNRKDYLLSVGLLSLVCSAASVWAILIPNFWQRSAVVNLLSILMSLALVPYGMLYCLYIYDGDRVVRVDKPPGNHPNIFCIVKGNGKAIVLAVFVFLDSTLKHQSKLWVTLFCVFFVIHLVHFMVVFGFTEEYDVAGGFIQASFVLLFEITTNPWQWLPLTLGAMFLTSYKTLLIEGVGPKIEELPVSGKEK